MDSKQPEQMIYRSSYPELLCRKGILRDFAKFIGKHLCQSLLGFRPAPLLKRKLWHRCFLVNVSKFMRTSFLQKTSGGFFWICNQLFDSNGNLETISSKKALRRINYKD